MKQLNSLWYNKKAGGFGLALIIIVTYVSIKLAKIGLTLNLFYTSLWFGGLVIGALAMDLFENVDSWVLHSLQIIENKSLTKKERIEMIKTQLEIAVDKYMVVFLMINGFENLWQRIATSFSKIYKGILTVKELIVLISYALYDLVIRDGTLSFLYPYDIGVIYGVLILLAAVDAKAGVAQLIVSMYKEIAEGKDQDITLNKLTEFIKQLAHIFHIETTTPTVDVNTMSEPEIKNLLIAIKQRQAVAAS